jgi:hypothetical protein
VVRFNLARPVLLLLRTSLLMPLAAKAQTAKATAGALQGTVLLENDSIPVSDAKIFAFNETTVTSTLSDRRGVQFLPASASSLLCPGDIPGPSR